MAIAGPVVATSATGEQLAIGPRGLPGNQGPPGVPGPPGTSSFGQGAVALTGGSLNSNVAVANTSSIRFTGCTVGTELGGLVLTPLPNAGVPFDVEFDGPIALVDSDASSSAGNQILTGSGKTVLLPPGQKGRAKFVRTVVGGVSTYNLQHNGVHQVTTVKLADFPGVSAIGDGTTDCLAAFQAADAYLVTQGGGTIEIGMGARGISATYKPSPGVNIKGAGVDVSSIVLLVSSQPQDVIYTGSAYVGNGAFVGNNLIEGLTVQNLPAYGGGGEVAVWSPSTSIFHVGGALARSPLPANVLFKCVAGSGPSGAHTPIGQLVAFGNQVPQLLGQVPTNATLDCYIKITVAGLLGTAKFQYSLDGGSTYNGADIPTTAGQTFQYVIPGTGYTLQLGNPPGGYVSVGGGAIFQPYPPIWVTGTPNAEWLAENNAAIDVYIDTPGPLGTMTFFVSISGGDQGFRFVEFGSTSYATVAGTSYAFTGTAGAFTTATGLTLHFGSGHYSTVAGANYTSASFGFSAVVGSQIFDGGYTWEVVPGCACIADSSTGLKVRDVNTLGGNFGIVLDQSELTVIEHVSSTYAYGAGLWLTNGADRTMGYVGGLTNVITVTGVSQFGSQYGWGVIDDGGNAHSFIGQNNYASNPSGWIRIAIVAGLRIGEQYVEDVQGRSRDVTAFCRTGTGFSFEGFHFDGNYCNAVTGASVLDLWNGLGFAAHGNSIQGPSITAAFTGMSTVANFFPATGQQGGNWVDPPTTPLYDFNGDVYKSGIVAPSPYWTVMCETLTASTTIYVPVMLEGDELGIVDYDQNCTTGGKSIVVVPPPGWQIQDPATGLYLTVNSGSYGTPTAGSTVTFTKNGEAVSWRSDGTSKLFIAP